MSKLPFSTFKQDNVEYEVVDQKARNDIASLSDNKNRRIIIMGDSYNTSSDGSTGTIVTSVGDRIKAFYPDRASEIVANWDVGGAGFGVKADTYTFEEYLDTVYNTVSDRDTVTDLLLFGGYNEVLTSNMQNEIDAGVSFCEKVKTYFPNCKVHLAFVAWSTRSDSEADKMNSFCYPIYQLVAISSDNACLVSNAKYILHTYSNLGTDGVHPTNAGYDALALQLGAYILNDSEIDVYGYNTGQTLTITAASSQSSVYARADRRNAITHIEIPAITLGQNTFSGHRLKIGTLQGIGFIKGFNRTPQGASIKIFCNPAITYNGNANREHGYIEIKNGDVYLFAYGFNNLTVTSIYIDYISADIMTELC